MTTEKYLKLKKNSCNWWYQRRVPKAIQHLVIDTDKIDATLDTADIKLARKKRDIINGRLADMALNPLSSPQKAKDIVEGNIKELTSKRDQFIELVNQMAKRKEQHPIDWDLPYDIDTADEVFLEAYQTVNGKRNFRYKYKITIKESLKGWVAEYQVRNKPDHISKVKKVVADFLTYLEVDNIQLEEINKGQVKGFIALLFQSYKKSTVTGYISRLRTLWTYSTRAGDLKGDSPFEGHDFYSEDKVDRKEMFSASEMQWLKENVAINEPQKRLLLELGVYTGCRISELCNIKSKHVISNSNIIAIDIEKGKNDAATRTIPLTTDLGQRVKNLADTLQSEDLVLGMEGKEGSRWFSRIKQNNISTDSTKCFHSFRVMFATALHRAEVPELKAAALLGHSRGKTMTFGYYSRGYELEQLKVAYDQGVTRIQW